MPLKNEEFEQMQATSRLVQPPISDPDVYLVTHDCAQVGSPFCAEVRPASTAVMATMEMYFIFSSRVVWVDEWVSG